MSLMVTYPHHTPFSREIEKKNKHYFAAHYLWGETLRQAPSPNDWSDFDNFNVIRSLDMSSMVVQSPLPSISRCIATHNFGRVPSASTTENEPIYLAKI
ncbi:hypothetical protein AVEN_27567-1 [Araneus ventricosus]|uniref:Uncharacterized protein n=1 Tax=Araneus ventricosus TaxID=182803 RepID=A0A4Y2SDS0_ARAVE|nr:hypothetical protein AVEN_13946-1 [Araneus ventricosus]GBN85385.1 hypothetical protein AVEN_27567-1 [Araneus ventricosus]